MAKPESGRRKLRVYRVNTGSCGGCDLEIGAAVAAADDIVWALEPADADLLLLTGPLTHGARPLVTALIHEAGAETPILAVGRCSIDGYPFGRGGLAEVSSITARLTLDGCAPAPEQIAAAIRRAVLGGEE